MTTAVATAPATTNGNGTESRARGENLPAIHGPRLPFHPLIEERFGIDRASWKALVEAIFPNASTIESVILALSYCRARKLDPFKRCVHIVPIWNSDLRRYIDTIWPGIGELRTTAFRTSEYAGRDDALFGADETRTFTGLVGKKDSKREVAKTVTFPQWAQVTVYRIVKGHRVAFAGPRVYWTETYATLGHDNEVPNDMWENRPRGQIEKCAEAAALRAAFPEEIGGDYIPEEVQHSKPSKVIEGKASETLDDLAARLEGPAEEIAATDSDSDTTPDPDPNFLEEVRQAAATLDSEASIATFLTEYQGRAQEDAEKATIQSLAEEARKRLKPAKKSA